MNRDEALFYEALEHGQPAAYLAQACAGDDYLRSRVERLLAAHGGRDNLLDQPVNVAVATCDISPTVPERAGDKIGPYKLIQQIGEGGMGVVYMAQQTEPVKRLVALKIIKPGTDSRHVIARFEAERQALALMDHPHIAKVLDAGTTESGRPYFVMELVKGIPITNYCDEKHLTPRERLELFIPVCHAVQHAHQKGIIHRDLKPSNVLIALYDGRPVPKVIDFGVAKATGGQLTEKTLVTNFGSLVGTVEYMSPEQAELNQLDVDTRSDIYALGVLLYELLTGSTPLDRQRLRSVAFNEMLRLIREEEAETVSMRIAKTRRVGSAHHHPRISGGHSPPYSFNPKSKIQNLKSSELDWIVMKALEKDRSRRYESAAAFAADIQRYLNDEPVHACPPTTMYRFQKFARKHKPAFLTAAAIALCLLLGTTVSAWQAVRATAAEAQANANEAQAQASAQEAKAKAQEASTQRNEAQQQRDEAQRQRDEVKALADKLAAKEQQLQRTLYTAHINLAHNAWNANNIRRVSQLLRQHHPKPDETDLRGFEWHYLNKLCHPEIVAIPRQGGGIAFSPDGKRLACGVTWDETKKAFGDPAVKICDAQTGRELLRLKAKLGSLSFSPDGKRLATAGNDELKVWDAETGKEVFSLNGHAGVVNCVEYSPDGKRLASSSAWALREGKWIKAPSQVKIWDAITGKELLTTTGQTGNVACVAFSPDGERLASGSENGTIKFWNVQTGQELLKFKADEEGVNSIAFSPDGKRLACGGNDGLKVWDSHAGNELLTVKGASGQVNSVAISPDGKRLASTGLARVVQVWDSQTGEEIFSFKGHKGWVSNAAFSPDGTRLASTGDGDVRIWDVSNDQKSYKLSTANFRRRSIGLTADGRRLTGTAIDPETQQATIKVWDVTNGQELLSIKTPSSNRLDIVAISPDGKHLAAGFGISHETKDEWIAGEVKLWDAETGGELATLKGHKWPVTDLSFAPDGSRVVSCGSNPSGSGGDQKGYPCEVKVWDATSGAELLAIQGHQSLVNAVAYSPDGKRLATLSRDNTVKIWDAQTGREMLSLPVQITGGGALAFSPDGKRLASTNKTAGSVTPFEAGEIKLWDAETGKVLFTFTGHAALVTSLAFSPDGKRLASGTGSGPGPSSSHEVKIWDAETGEELLSFPNIGSGGVAFSPDGHRLVSAGAEGLKIFDATPLPQTP